MKGVIKTLKETCVVTNIVMDKKGVGGGASIVLSHLHAKLRSYKQPWQKHSPSTKNSLCMTVNIGNLEYLTQASMLY